MVYFRRKSELLAVPAAVSLLMAASGAGAAGLWISEYGDPSMGRASAGAEAGTDDATASFHNPASMTRLDQDHVMVTGGVIYSRAEFDLERTSVVSGDGDGGNAGGLIPGAGAFYVKSYSENLKLGVSLGALTGAALDYDDDWAGRFQVQDVELLGIAISPSIGYRVNDWLSVGLAVPIMYTELEMDIATPNINQLGGPEGKATIDGDDVEVAFRPSILIEFSPQTRLGAYYQTSLEPSYGGDFTLKGEAADFQVGVDTDLALSEKAYAGFTHEFSDSFSGHLTAGWEGWSDMDNVFLSGEQNGAVLPRNWKDAWKGAVGIDYRLNDQWTLRTGFAYDQNVVSKHDRTADMPVDRQYRYAFGAEYQLPGGPSISGQLVYVDAGEARIEADGLGAGPGIGIADGFGGKYSTNDIYFFSVSASWVLGDNK